MKVIIAGMPKTGTKSIGLALHQLGMNVHDYMESYQYHGKEWIKICQEGGTTGDFREMYKGVDAVADSPVWYFWEELLEAFPESKVILTTRDNEDVWIRSLIGQVEKFNNPIMTMLSYLSPSYMKFLSYSKVLGVALYKSEGNSKNKVNELITRMIYRRHIAYVKENAPKNKLLVFNAKEGWEPLCKFLGVEVPSTPFPHKNVLGNIFEEIMAKNPLMIRMQREAIISASVLALLLSYGLYKCVKSNKFQHLSFMFRPILDKFTKLNFCEYFL